MAKILEMLREVSSGSWNRPFFFPRSYVTVIHDKVYRESDLTAELSL